MITGYGSASQCRNGASTATRSWTSRMYMIRLSSVTKFEISGSSSPKRRANAAWRTKELMATPPVAVVPAGDGLAAGGLVVDLVPGRADDRVAVEVLADVDAGLVDGEGVVVGRDRDVTDHEVRTPLGGHGVGRGHGRPVAVGEGHPLALPGLLGDARGAQLTGRDHHLGGLTVDLVPVHVEVVQAVEGPLGLEVLVGVGDHARVEQADVAHRLLVVEQLRAR